MNINLLSPEEKSRLCEIIPIKDFRDFSKNHNNLISKPGFRPQNLTKDDILSFVIKHIDDYQLIANFINERLSKELNKIQENIHEQNGNEALAKGILDSLFVNDVDLYLKLAEIKMDADTRSSLVDKIASLKPKNKLQSKNSNQILSQKDEKSKLLEEIKTKQKTIDDLKQQIKQILDDKASLETSLHAAQDKITELEAVSTDRINNNTVCDLEILEKFNDTNKCLLPSDGSEEIISLCCLTILSDKKWLFRHADLNSDGIFKPFRKDDNNYPYHLNIEKLYFSEEKNEKITVGFYGIWNWSVKTRNNKPFTKANFNKYIDAIEIIIRDSSNLDDLINLLKTGIKHHVNSRKIFISFLSNGRLTGVLCDEKTIKNDNEIIILKNECIEIPVYELLYSDILELANGISFFKKAFIGVPIKLYRLKNPLDIVRSIVLTSISWTKYKSRGWIRQNWQEFRDFLKAPVEDITKQIEYAIEKKLHCSNCSAKELLDEFMTEVSNYINGNSLEDKILLSALSVNPELQNRTKKLVRTDWEKENENLLQEAESKLNSIKEKIQSATDQLNQIESSAKKIKSDEERIRGAIAEKEKLAADVEIAVAKRINSARENAADFIANMAFIGPLNAQSNVVTNSSESPINPYYTVSVPDDIKDLEVHHCWEDVINTAKLELREAGVAEKYCFGLGAFLCAAFIEKQPIILVGPNSLDIVNAFSAAVTGHKHGVLYCEGSYSHHIIENIGINGEKIVVINNLLASSWINRLPEIISKRDIFYVATHPYAEDIQVEPNSLYGYCLYSQSFL